MHQVFVSYSSLDSAIATKICQSIEREEIRCWIASRDVGPGENYQEAIVKAISKSRMMVLIFSSNANQSDEIKKELALASQNRLPVLPVRVEDVAPTGAFVFELSTRQWVDLFTNWEDQLEALLRHVKRLAETDPDQSASDTEIQKTFVVRSRLRARQRATLIGAARVPLAVVVVISGWFTDCCSLQGTKPPSTLPNVAPKETALQLQSPSTYPSASPLVGHRSGYQSVTIRWQDDLDTPFLVIKAGSWEGWALRTRSDANFSVYELQSDPPGGKLPFSVKAEIYFVTQALFRFNSTLEAREAAIVKEFGGTARHGAFEDVVRLAAILGGPRLIDLLKLRDISNPEILPYEDVPYWNQGPFVTYRGRTAENSRAYFVSVHDGVRLDDWRVVETIQKNQIDLGSWHFNRPILVRIDQTFMAEERDGGFFLRSAD